MLRRKLRSGVMRILRFAMSWLSFAARKWFSAAVTIARRCDGRAWNVRHTKFPNLVRACRPMRNPATCHFFCVQIAIDRLSPKSIHYLSRGESSELGLKAKGKRTSAPPLDDRFHET